MTITNNEQLKAAYALNMCTVSLSQIVDYNDINVLKQEYDAILNNLNIENIIKDEAMLEALKKILDTCHFYILHDKDNNKIRIMIMSEKGSFVVVEKQGDVHKRISEYDTSQWMIVDNINRTMTSYDI